MAAEILARAAGVQSAIAAGRIRFELGEFKSKHLGNMVGQREVRKWFPGIEWS